LQADEFIEHIRQDEVAVLEIARREKQQLQQQWRATFAFRLNTQPGRRTSDHRDWHVFSSKQSVCRNGTTALDLYTHSKSADFFIIPEVKDLPGLRCTSGALPDLSSLKLDLYVSPPDFAWTMVFTYEQPWHGPYFARREWQKIKL
jgi:hypothetical protein